MNDKDLWPITLIFVIFMIALVLVAIKYMFVEILNNPVPALAVLAVGIGALAFLQRR